MLYKHSGPRPTKKEKPLPFVAVILLLLVAGVVGWKAYTFVPKAPVIDRTVGILDLGPFVGVDVLGGDGWVITVKSTWPGMTDRHVASTTCETIAKRFERSGAQTVLISTLEGHRVVECQ